MAWLIKRVDVKKGDTDSLSKLLGAEVLDIRTVGHLEKTYLMVVDDLGMVNDAPFNPFATSVYGAPIHGDVLFAEYPEELS